MYDREDQPLTIMNSSTINHHGDDNYLQCKQYDLYTVSHDEPIWTVMDYHMSQNNS